MRHNLGNIMKLILRIIMLFLLLLIMSNPSSIRTRENLTRKDPRKCGYLRIRLFLLQISLAAKKTKHNMSWYLDSGFSRHMTERRSMFQDLVLKSTGEVKFGGDQKGKIIGSGTISTGNSPSISNVLLVEGLVHKLLS